MVKKALHKILKPVDLVAYDKATFDIERQLTARGVIFRPLLPNDLTRYSHGTFNPLQGWAISADVKGQRFELIGLIDCYFPLSPPKFFVADLSLVLSFPHIEKDGSICLLSSTDIYLPSIDASGFLELFDLAVENLRLGVTGENQDDFHNEFSSYWSIFVSRHCPFQKRNNISILSLSSPETKVITYIYYKNILLFSDDLKSGKLWLKNHTQAKQSLFRKNSRTGSTILIWFSSPLKPYDFPQKSIDIFNLTLELEGDEREILKNVLLDIVPAKGEGHLPMLIGFNTINGPVLAGIQIAEPWKSSRKTLGVFYHSRHSWISVVPKRAGKAVRRLFYHPNTPISPFSVDRADSEWIHFRGGMGTEQGLNESVIAIIGCGAIGGYVAHQLAKDGVGTIVLIDHDTLSTGNIGRHILGLDYGGMNKARAMIKYINKSFPHVNVKFYDKKWEDVYLTEEGNSVLCEECNLIISLTGDARTDMALNYISTINNKLPAIIYGRTEAYGCAGHAILIDGEACLQCGIDTEGKFIDSVVEWNKLPMKKSPECGESFAPYGNSETAPITGMISRLAIDYLMLRTFGSEYRVWLSHISLVQACDGRWHRNWIKKYGNPGDGERCFRFPWKIRHDCEVCK